jgi:hypothetical protein
MTSPYSGFKPRTRPSTPARSSALAAGDFLRKYADAAEAAVAEPFNGVTTDGTIVPGLFRLAATGVSTRPIREAADAFLASLTSTHRASALFPVDSDAWRRWSNIHPWVMRHGVCLDALTPAQRDRALALLAESLSVRGFETARDVMRLNETIREVTGRDDEYGEWLYWISILGTPSEDRPWGWQLDGHHLNVNCLVLGDQVVMTPTFMGSEPTTAETGKYAGTRVFAAEEASGLGLLRSMSPAQRARTILAGELPGEAFAVAFRDNLVLRHEGIRYGELTTAQQELLLDLIETYVGRLRPGHARLQTEDVRRHLADTHFAWMGGADEPSVFYYRIHSPVILIEFDHQRGIALDNDAPSRHHIHTVVRTPNGNDYGRDLLRQHHAAFDHRRPGHHHAG